MTTIDLNDYLDELARRVQSVEQQLSDPNIVGNAFDQVLLVDPATGNVVTILSTVISPATGISATTVSFLTDIAVNVTWAAPADGSAASYEVEIARKDTTTGVYTYTSVMRTGGTTAMFRNLSANTTYGVRVTSLNQAGLMAASDPATGYLDIVTGKDTNVPHQPSGIVAFAVPHGIVMRWTDVVDADVASGAGVYQIDVSTTSNGSNIVKSSTVSGTVTAIMDLSSNTQYWVRVTAITSSGISGPASAWTAVTTAQVSGTDIAAFTVTAGNVNAATFTGNVFNAITITASQLTAGTISAGNIALNGGNIVAGNPPNTGLIINSQGLRLYNAGQQMVILDSSGTATFNGALASGIQITSPVINGGTINGGTISGGTIQTLPYNNTYVKLIGTGSVYPYLEWIDLGGNFSISGGNNNFSIISSAGAGITGSGYTISLNLGTTNIQFTQTPTIDSGLSALKFISGGLQARTSGDGGYATFTASSIQSAADMTCGTTFHVGGAGVGTAETVDGGGIIVNGTFGNGYGLSMSYSGFAPGWITPSSMKLKTSIRSVDDEDLFDRIARVRAVRYNRKLTAAKSSEIIRKGEIGFIAEELRDIYPEVVEEVSDTLGINYLSLVPVLFEAVKRLHARVEELEGAK